MRIHSSLCLFFTFSPLLFSCTSRAKNPLPPESADAASTEVALKLAHDAAAPHEVAASTPDASPTIDARPEAEDALATKEAPEGMLFVPGGTFTMGADRNGEEDEHPAHAVTLGSFFLDKTEVTNRAYDACVAAKECHAKDRAIAEGEKGLFNLPNGPVVGVTAFDAEKYCAWKGKRLPREAEFERAVRGDDGRKYPWGKDEPTLRHTVFGGKHPEEVGSHPLGKGPYGHDDLAGNVWEWLADLYDPYAYKRANASKGEPGTCKEILEAQDELRAQGKEGYTGSNPIPRECERSIRGGAYNYDAFGLRSTNRVHHPPTFHLKMTGFRCAKDAER